MNMDKGTWVCTKNMHFSVPSIFPPLQHTRTNQTQSRISKWITPGRAASGGALRSRRVPLAVSQSPYGEASARQPIFWEKNQVEPGVQGLGLAVAQPGFVGSKLVFDVFRGYQWGPRADSRSFFEKKFRSKKGKPLKKIRLFFFDIGLILRENETFSRN